jgi:hypothetical protein
MEPVLAAVDGGMACPGGVVRQQGWAARLLCALSCMRVPYGCLLLVLLACSDACGTGSSKLLISCSRLLCNSLFYVGTVAMQAW